MNDRAGTACWSRYAWDGLVRVLARASLPLAFRRGSYIMLGGLGLWGVCCAIVCTGGWGPIPEGLAGVARESLIDVWIASGCRGLLGHDVSVRKSFLALGKSDAME